MKEKLLYAVYRVDSDKGFRIPGDNEIITVVEIEFDDTDPEILMEDYEGILIPSPTALSRKALKKAAKKMGWQDKGYFMGYGAFQVTRERIERYKKEVIRLFEGLKKLEDL